MKRLIYIFLLVGLALSSCNKDLFVTNPASSTPESVMFKDATAAQVAMDGMYRALYQPGVFVTANTHHAVGLGSWTLAQCLSCEDNVQRSMGSGWYWTEYRFTTMDSQFTSTYGRQWGTWYMFYSTISQCNFAISHREMLEKTSAGKSVLGQALAMRGFAYLCLTESFCQGNYTVNKDTPGVPIYIEPTTKDTEGNTRGTLEVTLKRAADDLDDAIAVFATAAPQAHISHIDLYVAHGLRARVAMVMGDWDAVSSNALAALAKPNLTPVATLADLGGLSDAASAKDVLWSFIVDDEAASVYANTFAFLDSADGAYVKDSGAQHLIDQRLYNLIPATDERKTKWWKGDLGGADTGKGDKTSYCNTKFKFKNKKTGEVDIFNLRAEELVLMAAEAACVKSQWDDARTLLKEFGKKRDTGYEARLAAMSDASTYGTNTMAAPTTLREEILFQRRIELWTEGMGRRFDLRRLNLGFTRENSNHTLSFSKPYAAGDPNFVFLIPQKEIDNNKNIDGTKDQNPRVE